MTAEFLKKVTDLCRRHGALLYADEVHRGLPLSSETGQPWTWEVAPGECVVVGSLSKTYGLRGLRIGWSVAPDYGAGVRRIRAYTSISPSVLSEDLAVRVLGVGRALLDAQQAHARRNLAHADAFLNQTHHGLSWVSPSEGTVGFVRFG